MKQFIVDGYNLLFLVGFPGEDLHSQRDALVNALSTFSRLFNLRILLVFDSQFQKGESTLSQKGGIQIIYTNEGETADDHILSLIETLQNPNQTTLITSDKRLACKARALHIKTQEVKSFFEEMKLRLSKKNAPRPPKEPVKEPMKEAPPKKTKESSQDYYLRQFSLSYEQLEAESIQPSPSKSKNKVKKSPRPALIESDMARWLRLFGENQ